MTPVRTQADLQRFLLQEAAPLDDDADAEAEEKLLSSLRIISEDLADGRDAVGKAHASSALNNLEEAMMIYGECVALALGYKIRDDAASFHWRAIECLVLYTEVFAPKLSIYARRFQSLRAARRQMKYDRITPGEGQLEQFLAAATAFDEQFREIPAQVLGDRRAGRPNRRR